MARVGDRLGDHPAGLAPAKPYVVGPLERDDSRRDRLHRLGHRDAGDQAQRAASATGICGAQDEGA